MQNELELIGLFVFGISGALLAIRRDFDVIGIAILAVITALGGGIVRDLVLGDSRYDYGSVEPFKKRARQDSNLWPSVP